MIITPDKCPACGSKYVGGATARKSRMKPGLRIFFGCGSMSADKDKINLNCSRIEQLQAENKELIERIKFAIDYLPECPDQAKAFLMPALKGGEI